MPAGARLSTLVGASWSTAAQRAQGRARRAQPSGSLRTARGSGDGAVPLRGAARARSRTWLGLEPSGRFGGMPTGSGGPRLVPAGAALAGHRLRRAPLCCRKGSRAVHAASGRHSHTEPRGRRPPGASSTAEHTEGSESARQGSGERSARGSHAARSAVSTRGPNASPATGSAFPPGSWKRRLFPGVSPLLVRGTRSQQATGRRCSAFDRFLIC